MPLVTSRGYNLVPDVSPLTQKIGQAIQSRQKIAREDELTAKKAKVAQVKDDLLRTASHADRSRDIKDPISQRTEIAKIAQGLTVEGKDASMWTDLLQETNPDQLNLGLTRIFTSTGDAGKLFGEALKGDADQFEPVLDDEGNIIAQRNVQTGKVIKDPRAVARAKTGGVSEVQSSKILPGGLVQIVRKDGTTEVIPAKEAGQVLVKVAEERGAELQGLRAGERGAAAESQKLAVVAFKKLAPIQKSIRNIEKGIRLIDEGAKTGVIQSKMPSIRQASIELDNIQAQMGLDVIGSTTFGALSESELAFALSAALPKKLKGPALRDWLERKRDAQRKLADYITEAAIFMGTPGNTMSGFLRNKKQQLQPKEDVAVEQQPAAPGKIKFLGFE